MRRRRRTYRRKPKMANKTRLEIVEVRGVGTSDERVFMRANEDLDLGDYILTDTTYRADGARSDKLRHVYEFAPKAIRKGEYVSLLSKEGTNALGKTTGANPSPIHKIYWGLKERIWNQTGDKAFLIYAPRSERHAIAVQAAQ